MTIPAAAWSAFTAELDLWAAAGQKAVFWWRDDDAADLTPALARLLALQVRLATPLALAVIPAQASIRLAECLQGGTTIVALQHGYAHHNHAPVGEKKSEFPASRSQQARLADIRLGRDNLAARLGSALLPVLVPPWNRIAGDMLPMLTELGFVAVSGFKPRADYWAAPGLAWLNTQLDPIDWHGSNNPAAARSSLEAATALLRAMRHGELPLQPVGFLTHHLRHDEFLWGFVASFVGAVARHPACHWIDTVTALAIGRPADMAAPVMRTS